MIKKRLTAFTLALLVLALLPLPALAVDELLVIDAGHVYAGMDKSYGQGYAPQVNGQEAVVRMPLVVSKVYQGNVQGSAIMVTPDLGDPRESPFIPGDYSQSVSLKRYAVQDGQGSRTAQSAYYIVLRLPLQAGRRNGEYPVNLQISYLNEQGLSIQQSFSVKVTVTDGAEPKEGTQQVSQIALANYDINPGVVQAGAGFSVDFTMQNTGKDAAKDILVSYNGETDDISLKGSTGTVFVSRIEKGAQQICHIELDTNENAKTGIHRIFLNIAYTDETSAKAAVSFEIPVMVRQPVRLQYGQPSIPEQAALGNPVTASLLIRNAGLDTLYDVAVSLASDGFAPGADEFLGNMESGADKTASVVVQPAGEPRTAAGKFIVTYEDESGTQYTEEVPFESRILPATVFYWRLPGNWAAIIAILVAAGASVAVYYLYKTRKKEDNPA